MWRSIAHAVFTGDRHWAWRRRAIFVSVMTCLAGMLHATFGDPDLAHASMVMSNCTTTLIAVLGIYTGAAVTDDHLKRKTDATASPGAGS
jgi:hypothetical protein